MWALELWEIEGELPLVYAMPIVDLDGNTRVEHGRDGMIVRTRGDCAHCLHALPDRIGPGADAAHVFLYCSTCERAIEMHVSEVPLCMRSQVAELLGAEVDWDRAAN